MHPSLVPSGVVFLADGKCAPKLFSEFNNAGLYRVSIKYALARTYPDGIKF